MHFKYLMDIKLTIKNHYAFDISTFHKAKFIYYPELIKISMSCNALILSSPILSL